MQGAAPLTVIARARDRRGKRIAEEESAHLRARGASRKVADDPAAIPAGAKVIDLSNATVLPGLIDAHTQYFPVGAGPGEGRLRRKHSEGRNRAATARATYAVRRALEQDFVALRDLRRGCRVRRH